MDAQFCLSFRDFFSKVKGGRDEVMVGATLSIEIAIVM